METRPARPSASAPNVSGGSLRPRESLGSAGSSVQGRVDPSLGEGAGAGSVPPAQDGLSLP